MRLPEDQLIAVAFSEPAKLSNHVSITTDANGMHRLAFLEVDPRGNIHHICAVFLSSQMLMQLHELFGKTLGAKLITKRTLIKAN